MRINWQRGRRPQEARARERFPEGVASCVRGWWEPRLSNGWEMWDLSARKMLDLSEGSFRAG